MEAVSCCSGGVMFVDEKIGRTTKAVSYREFVDREEAEQKKEKPFGKRKSNNGAQYRAA